MRILILHVSVNLYKTMFGKLLHRHSMVTFIAESLGNSFLNGPKPKRKHSGLIRASRGFCERRKLIVLQSNGQGTLEIR